MEQRRLRLGDILDDYCPRERRVTNHAVVAMVEEDVKQTRCTTCDAEHVYKGGKAPRQRKLEGTGKLYKQVLAGLTDDPVLSAVTVDGDMMDESDSDPRHDRDAIAARADRASGGPVVSVIDEQPRDVAVSLAADEPPDGDDSPETDDEPQPSFDDGPVHRPLIRAQLPRVEGVKLERQGPDFTIRQNNGRGSNFRGAHGHGGGAGNGQRFGRGPFRDRGGNGGNGGGRGANQGFGRGPGGGGGNGQPRHGGGPRKRGR